MFTPVVSALGGVILGMSLMLMAQRHRRASAPLHGVYSELEQGPSQNQVNAVAKNLYELSSQIEHKLGRHHYNVGEVASRLTEVPNIELLIDSSKFLLDANRQLQGDLQQAQREIEQQRQLMEVYVQQSLTDPLTGVSNRRSLEHELSRSLAESRRNDHVSSVLVIDIDHFKKVNDTYGHMVGDQLLKSFCSVVATTLREKDFLARYGGEEFVVLLDRVTLPDSKAFAEKLRRVIAETQFRFAQADARVTVSIGISQFSGADRESAILQAADCALYAAKNNGRNQSYFHEDGANYPVIDENAKRSE